MVLLGGWKPRFGMKFSKQEKRVLELLSQRKKHVAIALALGIAFSTVRKRHVYQLGVKLGVVGKRGISEAEHTDRIVRRAKELDHLD